MSSDNVAGMQAQHQILKESVNTVCESLKNGCTIDSLKDQLGDLASFLRIHCEEEEQLMKRYSHKGLEQHKRAHQSLINSLFSLTRQINTSLEEKQKQAILDFLETDFMGHVVEDVETWQEGKIDRDFVYRRLDGVAHGAVSSKANTR